MQQFSATCPLHSTTVFKTGEAVASAYCHEWSNNAAVAACLIAPIRVQTTFVSNNTASALRTEVKKTWNQKFQWCTGSYRCNTVDEECSGVTRVATTLKQPRQLTRDNN